MGEKQETEEEKAAREKLAEDVIRIEMLLMGAVVRIEQVRPTGNDEFARKWRVATDHAAKACTYLQQRIMTDPRIADIIQQIRKEAAASMVAVPVTETATETAAESTPAVEQGELEAVNG